MFLILNNSSNRNGKACQFKMKFYKFPLLSKNFVIFLLFLRRSCVRTHSEKSLHETLSSPIDFLCFIRRRRRNRKKFSDFTYKFLSIQWRMKLVIFVYKKHYMYNINGKSCTSPFCCLFFILGLYCNCIQILFVKLQ